LRAELQTAQEASDGRATELASLKHAAAASTATHHTLQQELHATAERLQQAQTKASQLKRESLQQTCIQQTARCNELEAELLSSGRAVSDLQDCLQAETKALGAVQEELQGDAICMSWYCLHTVFCTLERKASQGIV
jgi:chromosome segregation ATPase